MKLFFLEWYSQATFSCTVKVSFCFVFFKQITYSVRPSRDLEKGAKKKKMKPNENKQTKEKGKSEIENESKGKEITERQVKKHGKPLPLV